VSAALLAEALRALMPLARVGDLAARGDLTPLNHEHVTAARDALRKAAPCEVCGSKCLTYCTRCSGAGWTPASVEAAIARAAERERRDQALIDAASRWCAAEGGAIAENDAHIELIEAYGERQALGASRG
jgi:hypothetical protein